MSGYEAFSHENPPVTTPLLLSKRKGTLGAAYIRMRLRVKRLNVNSAPGHPLRAPHNRQGRPFLDGFSRVPVESKGTLWWRVSARMLLSRDFVGYMANEMVKRLVADKVLEAGKPAVLV